MPTTILDKVILNSGEETTDKPILVWNPSTRRVSWQKSPNPRIAALEAKLDSDNNFKFIPDPGYTFNAGTRVLTMNAGWIGTINGVDYTNAEQIFPAIPLAASGYSRIDLIVFKTDSTFQRIAGKPSLFTPVAPAKPTNTLEATFLTVGDGIINVPATPKPKAPVTTVNGMVGDVVIKKATDTVRGTVKIDTPTVDPVVYVKETVDTLLDAKANFFLDIKNITGITYNVILTDILYQLVYNGTLAMNVIIPNNSVVPFPIGTIFYTLGTNTGVVTASGAAGVTLNVKAGISLSAIQNEVRQYTKIGVNTWSVRGDLNLGAVTQQELSYLQGATSNLQAQINAKTALSGGTTNFLMKWLNATTATVSRIWDTGTFLGIGTEKAPTKDITLGNQANREIGIEESSNTIAGRDLKIRAGRTINYAPTGFIQISESDADYRKICVVPSTNNLYVLIGVYTYCLKQTNSTGIFQNVSIPAIARDICSYNGDLYACTINDRGGTGLVYKQTGETGPWVDLGFPARYYTCITITPEGNLYLGVLGGSIYKQTGLSGALVDLNQIANWNALGYSVNGNVYAGIMYSSFPLYKQTSGTGSFNVTSFSAASISCISGLTVTPNNDLYISAYNDSSGAGAIFQQINSEGAYVNIQNRSSYDGGLASAANGNVFAAFATKLYIQQNFAVGSPNLDGGTLKHYAGTGKGTGKSRFEVYTGQKLASGTDMQVETLREYIDENGYHVYTSMPVHADNAAALAANLPVGCKYRNATGDLKIVY